MSEAESKLRDLLGKFDASTDPLEERDVLNAISGLEGELKGSALLEELKVEGLAFSFYERRPGRGTPGESYFAPTPNLNEGIIRYWEVRAQTAKNPVLRARYADLIWEFGRQVIKDQPMHMFAQIAIDSYVEIARGERHKSDIHTIWKLERALSLALSIRDNARAEQVAEAMIWHENHAAEENKLGTWGFSFDTLIQGKKGLLSPAQENAIIAALEKHLEKAVESTEKHKVDPWAAEHSAVRLAEYYRKQESPEDVKRVLRLYSESFLTAASEVSGMQASGWLERVHATFIAFGLNDEAEEIAQKIRGLGEKVVAELKPISTEVKVSTKKVDEAISAITSGEIDQVLYRITAAYIPNKKKVEKQIKELAQEAPLSMMIPRQLLDSEGRPVANIGSLEADIDGHIVNQISQNLHFAGFLLQKVLETTIAKFPDFGKEYIRHLYQSPVFREDRRAIIEQAIQAYLSGDYLTSVHLLIPQIEATIRYLYEKMGGLVLKPARDGSFHLKVLDELLRDPILGEVLDENILLYLRVLLTDQRGWNLRNEVCHGLIDSDSNWHGIANRLLHALLCLSLIRKKEAEPKKEETPKTDTSSA